MTTSKILCPIDFSAGSQLALRTAVQLARARDAELVVMHAWQIPSVSAAGEIAIPSATVQDLHDDAERALAAAVSETKTQGATRVSSRFATGAAWDLIVEALRADPAFELCVVGSHGRTGITRFLLGSVAEKVVRHAPCSVLAVHRGNTEATFERVLCTTDFSPASRPATDLAGRLVARSGEITLLHVLELPLLREGEASGVQLADVLDERATGMLADWAGGLRAAAAVPINTRVRLGRAAEQILAVLAEQPPYDLVVIGSHGRTGLARALLGSVAEKVVRHAPCAVLVARARS